MEDLVRQLINYVYDDFKYIGKIKVTELKSFSNTHVGWRAELSFHSDYHPLDLAFDGNEIEFLDRLETILHRDHMHDTEYYDGHRYDPYNPPCTNYIEYHVHDCQNKISDEKRQRLSN